MRKRVRSALAPVVIGAVLLLGGCAVMDGGGTTGGSESTAGPTEAEERAGDVDVTIARALVDPDGSLTDEEIVASAADRGFTAVVDGDAVTYTMTVPQREDLLAGFRASAQDAVDDMVADDSNSITSVEFDDEMTEFTVSVDSERYSPLESLLVIAFYLQGALYQQFAGVSPDDVDVVVDFVDDATGEVLESGSYREWRQNLEG